MKAALLVHAVSEPRFYRKHRSSAHNPRSDSQVHSSSCSVSESAEMRLLGNSSEAAYTKGWEWWVLKGTKSTPTRQSSVCNMGSLLKLHSWLTNSSPPINEYTVSNATARPLHALYFTHHYMVKSHEKQGFWFETLPMCRVHGFILSVKS